MQSPVNGGPPKPVIRRFGHGLSQDPPELEDGYVLLPTKPGLGTGMGKEAVS